MVRSALHTPLVAVVGDKTAKALRRAFEMRHVGDVLAHYPRRYERRGELTPIDSVVVGEQATIIAEVHSSSQRRMRARSGSLLDAVIGDGHGQIRLTFFNQSWRLKDLQPGRHGIFSGKVREYRGGLELTHPDYELFDDDAAADTAENFRRAIVPIYPATTTVSSWQLARVIDMVLDSLGDVDDPVPEDLRLRWGLCSAHEAFEGIHRPDDFAQKKRAEHTLRVHEALILQSALVQRRAQTAALSAVPRSSGAFLDRFDQALPFALTDDQRTVGEQVSADLASSSPMNRLVHGEVGSGKTLVALRAMLQVAQSRGQSALIAPTEVLAAQHFRSVSQMLGEPLCSQLIPVLLTGGLSAADRRRAALAVASGQSLIVVGTHALLSEKTTFADLGLVVIDEQHRFGVHQRESLRAKGANPHTLVLTATPIPRTVAMTVFGDVDVSQIRTVPPGRAGVETFVAPVAEKPAWFARVWARVTEEAAKGYQVFVVCPAIDTENTDGGSSAQPEGAGPRWGVVQVAELLTQQPATDKLRVAILHGQLPTEEKDRVMRDFSAGAIDVLIATTVIEVGVDVPNASMMVVMEADRFGVSQLHQLRGRVGRGDVPGLCLLVTEAAPGTTARERVDAVAASTDGFELAEVDVRLRGEGDVLGQAQSGVRSSLRLLRVFEDAELISDMRAEAERLMRDGPQLSAYPELARAIENRLDGEEWAALAQS